MSRLVPHSPVSAAPAPPDPRSHREMMKTPTVNRNGRDHRSRILNQTLLILDTGTDTLPGH